MSAVEVKKDGVSPATLFLLFLIAPCLKFILILDQLTVPLYWPYDDLLYINWAKHLLDGNWLGPFSNTSLLKLPGYGLWIAAVKLLSIPLLFAEHLVGLLGASLIALLLRRGGAPALSSLVVFSLLVLAPHGFAYTQTRVFRDYFYAELTLLTLATLLSFFFVWRWRWVLPLAITSGFLLGFYSIVREEFIWFIPPAALIIPFFCIHHRKSGKALTGIFLRLVVGLCIISSLTFSAKQYIAYRNDKAYGEWRLSFLDFGDGPGTLMLGALARIDAGEAEIPFASITRKKLLQAFSVSPMMSSLKNPLHQIYLNKFTREGAFALVSNGEIIDGAMYFALTSSAAELGHFSSAAQAKNFFLTVKSEIDKACAAGSIKCMVSAPGILQQIMQPNQLVAMRENFQKVVAALVFPPYLSGEEQKLPGELEMLPFYSHITSDPIPSSLLKRAEEVFKFSPEFYQSQNPDTTGYRNLLEHYVWEGVQLGLKPSAEETQTFSPTDYLAAHRRFQNMPLTPLQHSLLFQGRDYVTDFPVSYLTAENYFRDGDPINSKLRTVFTHSYHLIAVVLAALGLFIFIRKGYQLLRKSSGPLQFSVVLSLITLVAIASRLAVLTVAYTLKFPLTGENARLLYPAHSLFALFCSLALAQLIESWEERRIRFRAAQV